MTTATYALTRPPWRERLAYELRVLHVMARTQFKLKYVDSILGYVWSLAKPLSYFAVLWVVFGQFFNTGIDNFAAYLLLGIVLYTFLFDAVGSALPSILERGPLLRRIAFPPLVIPVSATVTASMTFGVNVIAVAVFIALSGIVPDALWLLLPLLVLQLYLFILGLALLVSTLFVRFRDIGPIWELVAQLMLFASPIMYPITILPEWAERLAMLNPFVQVLQDVRRIILGSDEALGTLTSSAWMHVATIVLTFGTLLFGLWVYRHDAPSFAEKV